MREIIAIDSFQEVLGTIDGGKILDIASGAGQFIDVLVGSLGSWEHMTGLDLNEEIMQEARQKFDGDKFLFVTGSAMDIPFEPGSFDLVCMSKGLHHVPDRCPGTSGRVRIGYRLWRRLFASKRLG